MKMTAARLPDLISQRRNGRMQTGGLHQRNDFENAFRSQLGKRVSAMHFHGAGAEALAVCNQLVGHALQHDRYNLPLALGQSIDQSKSIVARTLRKLGLAKYAERLIEGLVEHFESEGLFEELDRTQLHRTHRDRDIGVRGDHNHRPRYRPFPEKGQHLEAVNVGHADIKQDRRRLQIRQMIDEIDRRREGPSGDRLRCEQKMQRFPHVVVVVYDVSLALGIRARHLIRIAIARHCSPLRSNDVLVARHAALRADNDTRFGRPAKHQSQSMDVFRRSWRGASLAGRPSMCHGNGR